MKNIINKTETYVMSVLGKEPTGHDWWHADRVRKLALHIAKHVPNADLQIVELAALLHDIADWKFHNDNEEIGPQTARRWLVSLNNVPELLIAAICDIIKNISFKGATVNHATLTLEGQIVQDADRLDAMGAIGIARAFAFGGNKGHEIYNPDEEPIFHNSFAEYKLRQASSINHFHEKLLLLKDRMNTQTGRDIAKARHQYMLNFLQEFDAEWNSRF